MINVFSSFPGLRFGYSPPFMCSKNHILQLIGTSVRRSSGRRRRSTVGNDVVATIIIFFLRFFPPSQPFLIKHVIKMSLGGACQTSLGPHIFTTAPD